MEWNGMEWFFCLEIGFLFSFGIDFFQKKSGIPCTCFPNPSFKLEYFFIAILTNLFIILICVQQFLPLLSDYYIEKIDASFVVCKCNVFKTRVVYHVH